MNTPTFKTARALANWLIAHAAGYAQRKPSATESQDYINGLRDAYRSVADFVQALADKQSTNNDFSFVLLRDTESMLRRMVRDGRISASDYGLPHEIRALAVRYEAGDFAVARKLLRDGAP